MTSTAVGSVELEVLLEVVELVILVVFIVLIVFVVVLVDDEVVEVLVEEADSVMVVSSDQMDSKISSIYSAKLLL